MTHKTNKTKLPLVGNNLATISLGDYNGHDSGCKCATVHKQFPSSGSWLIDNGTHFQKPSTTGQYTSVYTEECAESYIIPTNNYVDLNKILISQDDFMGSSHDHICSQTCDRILFCYLNYLTVCHFSIELSFLFCGFRPGRKGKQSLTWSRSLGSYRGDGKERSSDWPISSWQRSIRTCPLTAPSDPPVENFGNQSRGDAHGTLAPSQSLVSR